MHTGAIHRGDPVLVNRLGRLFCARVTGVERAGVVAVEPLDRRVSHRSAKAREIVDHWTRAQRRVGRLTRPAGAQGPRMTAPEPIAAQLDVDEVLELAVRDEESSRAPARERASELVAPVAELVARSQILSSPARRPSAPTAAPAPGS